MLTVALPNKGTLHEGVVTMLTEAGFRNSRLLPTRTPLLVRVMVADVEER